MREIDRRDFLKVATAAAGGFVALASGLNLEGRAEASATPEDLPEHITYFEAGAAFGNKAGEVTVPLLKKGDMLHVMSQKVKVMGVDWDIDPTNHPDQTQVIAIVNQGDKPVNVTYQTFNGIFWRQDREKTSRLDRNSLIEDVNTAALVQVSRSRIPGNCVPTGCAATRVITALVHADANGNPVFEGLPVRTEVR